MWRKKDKSLSPEEKRAAEYTTSEEFCAIFDRDKESLYTLALMLTGDHEKAEQCFVNALEDCLSAKVFRNWERSWTRLAVIERAMRMIKPLDSRTLQARDSERMQDDRGLHPDGRSILKLTPFDRFVFVMSVLERYSVRDCAILLKCAWREVQEARRRAIEFVANSTHHFVPVSTAASSLPQQI